MNCRTIPETSFGITFLITNQRAAKNSCMVICVKLKYFVVASKDFLKGGPQWRRPLPFSFSISSERNVSSMSLSSKIGFFFKSNLAANSDNISNVFSTRSEPLNFPGISFVLNSEAALCFSSKMFTTSE